eukprot:1041739-Prorocentrum_minimum.AAC.1
MGSHIRNMLSSSLRLAPAGVGADGPFLRPGGGAATGSVRAAGLHAPDVRRRSAHVEPGASAHVARPIQSALATTTAHVTSRATLY